MLVISTTFWKVCLVSIFCFEVNAVDIDPEDGDGVKFLLELKQSGVNQIFYNFTQYDQLTSSTYILDYNGSRRGMALHKTVSQIKRRFKKQILKLEITKEHNNIVKPVDTHTFESCYECKTSDKGNCLAVLEYVIVQLDRQTIPWKDIKVTVISPNGTMSVLMDSKKRQDKGIDEKKLWLVSAHFSGETAFGKWQILVQDKQSASNIRITGLTLKLYGTAATTLPKTYQRYSDICSSNERTRTSKSKPAKTKTPISENKAGKEDDDDYFTENIVPYLPLMIMALFMFSLHLYIGVVCLFV